MKLNKLENIQEALKKLNETIPEWARDDVDFTLKVFDGYLEVTFSNDNHSFELEEAYGDRTRQERNGTFKVWIEV